MASLQQVQFAVATDHYLVLADDAKQSFQWRDICHVRVRAGFGTLNVTEPSVDRWARERKSIEVRYAWCRADTR
jgi:hypothetical protein